MNAVITHRKEKIQILRIDHVSIAARDHANARHFFEHLLGAVAGAGADDETLRYHWQIFSLGDMSRLELLHPTGPESFLDGFLKRREGGVHHITLQTADIRQTMQRLEEHAISYFGFKEYGDCWKEVFIHPRDAFGVLIQIAEFDPEDFLNQSVKFDGGRKWDLSSTDAGVRLSLALPGGGKAHIELAAEEAMALSAASKQAIANDADQR